MLVSASSKSRDDAIRAELGDGGFIPVRSRFGDYQIDPRGIIRYTEDFIRSGNDCEMQIRITLNDAEYRRYRDQIRRRYRFGMTRRIDDSRIYGPMNDGADGQFDGTVFYFIHYTR